MFSQMFVAMNSEIPEPNPYPLIQMLLYFTRSNQLRQEEIARGGRGILLKQLIQNQNNDSREEELEDDEERVTSTKLVDFTIHA